VTTPERKTGFLIIAHGALGEEMLSALTFIAGAQPHFHAVALDHAVEVDKARSLVEEAIEAFTKTEGVIILTDLFGGAPSNIAISFVDEKPIEIVAGVNMPILLRATTLADDMPLQEKAVALRDYGKNNIFIVSEVLAGKNETS